MLETSIKTMSNSMSQNYSLSGDSITQSIAHMLSALSSIPVNCARSGFFGKIFLSVVRILAEVVGNELL
jgi:hypothetical protein